MAGSAGFVGLELPRPAISESSCSVLPNIFFLAANELAMIETPLRVVVVVA